MTFERLVRAAGLVGHVTVLSITGAEGRYTGRLKNATWFGDPANEKLYGEVLDTYDEVVDKLTRKLDEWLQSGTEARFQACFEQALEVLREGSWARQAWLLERIIRAASLVEHVVILDLDDLDTTRHVQSFVGGLRRRAPIERPSTSSAFEGLTEEQRAQRIQQSNVAYDRWRAGLTSEARDQIEKILAEKYGVKVDTFTVMVGADTCDELFLKLTREFDEWLRATMPERFQEALDMLALDVLECLPTPGRRSIWQRIQDPV